MIYLEDKLQKDHIMYENIIADMKEEIKAVLAKNVLLGNEISRVNEIRTQEKYVNDTIKE